MHPIEAQCKYFVLNVSSYKCTLAIFGAYFSAIMSQVFVCFCLLLMPLDLLGYDVGILMLLHYGCLCFYSWPFLVFFCGFFGALLGNVCF